MQQFVIIAVLFLSTVSLNAYTVQKTADVTYGKGWVTSPSPGLKDLKMDVYYPDGNSATDKTAMIFIHGGGFEGGDKGTYATEGVNYFVGTKGHVVFNINYRMIEDGLVCPNLVDGGNLTQQAGYAAIVDAKRAVRWVRAHADSFGIDPERVVTLGGSAGGYVSVALAVLDEDTLVSDGAGDQGIPYGNPGENSKPNACVEMFGYLFHWLPTYYEFFDSTDAPMCAMTGDNDVAIVFPDYFTIRTYCRRRDIPLDFYVIEGGIHGEWFDSTEVWVDTFLEDHLYNPVSAISAGPGGRHAPDAGDAEMSFPGTLSVKALRRLMRTAAVYGLQGVKMAPADIRPGAYTVRLPGHGVYQVVVIK